MKIRRNNRDELVLESRPWATALLIVAGMLVVAYLGLSKLSAGAALETLWVFPVALAMCGVALVVFARFERARFDRVRRSLQLQRISLIGREGREFALADIDQASVETMRSGPRKTHRPVLSLGPDGSHGREPLTSAYVSGRGAHRAADAVNAWLDTARGQA